MQKRRLALWKLTKVLREVVCLMFLGMWSMVPGAFSWRLSRFRLFSSRFRLEGFSISLTSDMSQVTPISTSCKTQRENQVTTPSKWTNAYPTKHTYACICSHMCMKVNYKLQVTANINDVPPLGAGQGNFCVSVVHEGPTKLPRLHSYNISKGCLFNMLNIIGWIYVVGGLSFYMYITWQQGYFSHGVLLHLKYADRSWRKLNHSVKSGSPIGELCTSDY